MKTFEIAISKAMEPYWTTWKASEMDCECSNCWNPPDNVRYSKGKPGDLIYDVKLCSRCFQIIVKRKETNVSHSHIEKEK